MFQLRKGDVVKVKVIVDDNAFAGDEVRTIKIRPADVTDVVSYNLRRGDLVSWLTHEKEFRGRVRVIDGSSVMVAIGPDWEHTKNVGIVERSLLTRLPPAIEGLSLIPHDEVKPAVIPEPIPNGVYYNVEHDNFYDIETARGCGNQFYKTWKARCFEFPQSRGAVVSLIPHGEGSDA